MKLSYITGITGFSLLTLGILSCGTSGDPTANRGYASGARETTYVAATDGEVSLRALTQVAKYIRSSRKLGHNEEQILQQLAQREVDGYRVSRLRVLQEQKRKIQTRIQTSRKSVAKKINRINKSSASTTQKKRQIAEVTKAQKTEEKKLRKELVLVEHKISLEKSKSYILPVKEPGQTANRSIVIVEPSMKIKESKIYNIDRDITDLAKVMESSGSDSIAVLSNAKPLSAN